MDVGPCLKPSSHTRHVPRSQPLCPVVLVSCPLLPIHTPRWLISVPDQGDACPCSPLFLMMGKLRRTGKKAVTHTSGTCKNFLFIFVVSYHFPLGWETWGWECDG